MDISEPYKSLCAEMEVKEEIVFTFFLLFSRFEYALKRSGFTHLRSTFGEVSPNWQSFSRTHKQDIEKISSPTFLSAKKYILGKEPKKQVIRNNKLDWAKPIRRKFDSETEVSEVEHVLDLVLNVRNNLFHGGKFHVHIDDPTRNPDLLTHCTNILQEVLNVDATVKEHFYKTDF